MVQFSRKELEKKYATPKKALYTPVKAPLLKPKITGKTTTKDKVREAGMKLNHDTLQDILVIRNPQPPSLLIGQLLCMII
jgi:hypothetical protein